MEAAQFGGSSSLLTASAFLETEDNLRRDSTQGSDTVLDFGDFLRYLAEVQDCDSKPIVTIGSRLICVGWMFSIFPFAGKSRDSIARQYKIPRRRFSGTCKDFSKRFGIENKIGAGRDYGR